MEKREIAIGVVAIVFLITTIIFGVKYLRAYALLEEAIGVLEAEVYKQEMIDDCLDGAYTTYINNWNEECHVAGLGDDCRLEIWRKEMFDTNLEENQDRCVERYK